MITIGLDLDNTLIDYSDLFVELAVETEMVEPSFDGTRIELRDRLRAEGAELKWRELQALAYGPRIGGARLADGALEFVDRALAAGANVYIVSHKTQFAAAAPEGPNLRDCAVEFLRERGLLGDGRLARGEVHFADTVADKVGIIESLGCTHFVDDLPRVLAHPSFPETTRGLLFGPRVTWNEIAALVFER